MVRAVVALLAVALASSAEAQTMNMTLPVVCGPVERMMGSVMGDEFKELPYVGWAIRDGIFGVITLNAATKTSTVFLIKEDTACIVSSGIDTKTYNVEPKPKKDGPGLY